MPNAWHLDGWSPCCSGFLSGQFIWADFPGTELLENDEFLSHTLPSQRPRSEASEAAGVAREVRSPDTWRDGFDWLRFRTAQEENLGKLDLKSMGTRPASIEGGKKPSLRP